jgi:3-dehydroquinate synthase
MHTLTIIASNHTYPIYIGRGLLANQALLNQYIVGNQVFVVTNETVAKLYLPLFLTNFDGKQCDYIVLPDGEAYKNIANWSKIIDALMSKKHRRSTTIIALGGGVIGDLTGFAAACYQRGVNFLQIPTTLLAQVDSSIGGKTAVNHPDAKNMIGAFYPPQAVIIDIDALKTLPKRELAAGYAEIIKHALIADPEFFAWLEKNQQQLLNLEADSLEKAILRSCEIKAAIVGRDEFEQGERAFLNFGHTFAHALEALTGYNTLLHGEAVAIGMVMACRLSVELGYISPTMTERVLALLSALDLPVSLPVVCSIEQIVNEMQHDKKATDAGLRFIVLEQLGKAKIVENISTQQVRTILKT